SEVILLLVLRGVSAIATSLEVRRYPFPSTATDHDLPANTLTFSLVGAPAGASIDAATGVFTWTPSEAQGPGSYSFQVRVTDDGGDRKSVVQGKRVGVGSVAPVLSGVPASG